MKAESSSQGRRFAVIAALTAVLFSTLNATAQELVDPPEDQEAGLGQTVTFNAEPRFPDLSLQWLRQWPDHDELLAGQTSSSLTLTNVALADVGLYACIAAKGDQIQITRAAALTVSVVSGTSSGGKKSRSASQSQSVVTMGGGGGPLTIFAPPVANSGSSGNCPGTYAGYVNYTKTVAQGWGWAPDTNTTTHTASDLNRSDTKVEYSGKFFDRGCAQTMVTIPHPTHSPKYRFTIYFPNNVPTTNAYAITLVGFNP